MTQSISRRSDVLGLLIASGLLGLRGFWKVSSLSKETLGLRDDTTSLGFGSVLTGMEDVSERESILDLLKNCIQIDNVRALQQVLALDGVAGRYPHLLRLALEHKAPGCVSLLMDMDITPEARELSERAVSSLTPEWLRSLLQRGIVRPDSWVETGTLGDRRQQPLLTLLIDERNFECAELLLGAGARVDVFEWCSSGVFEWQSSGRTPLQALVLQLAADRNPNCDWKDRESLPPLSEVEREKGLSLLRLLAEAASSRGSRCLDWEVVVGCENSPGGRSAVKSGWREGANSNLPLAAVATGFPLTSLDFENDNIDSETAEILEALAEGRADLDGIEVSHSKRDPAVMAHVHTALSLACTNGYLNSARVLLDRGAWPGGCRKEKWPYGVPGRLPCCVPLVETVKGAEFQPDIAKSLVRLLIAKGADSNEPGYTERGFVASPLQVLLQLLLEEKISSKDANDIAKCLVSGGARCSLSQGPHREAEALPGHRQKTLSPLAMASKAQDAGLVQLLCEEGGGNPNARGKSMRTGPANKDRMWEAMGVVDYPIFFALGDPGSDFRGLPAVSAEKAREERDKKAAAVLGRLVDAGAEMDRMRYQSEGSTPLILACSQGLVDSVRVLLDRGAPAEGVQFYNFGRLLTRVPLVESLGSFFRLRVGLLSPSRHLSLVSLLLQKGANPNERGASTETFDRNISPLEQALRYGSEWKHEALHLCHLVRLLTVPGARCSSLPGTHSPGERRAQKGDSPMQTPAVLSPLLLACQLEKPCVVRVLCEEGGADPNAPGRWSLESDADPGVVRPLEFVLFHSSAAGWRDASVAGERWSVVETLLQMGANPEDLAAASRRQSLAFRTFLLEKLRETAGDRGPSLEPIVRVLSLQGEDAASGAGR
uniref:Uncharacterized protein n=1 Tax=Chromera velia CCMP2878 TaxID=1169474 RepID=A0A0G4FRH5_9ALVE|eukprot:Cvel_18296.t1-p1 / transcript=Cvel_18296.t1 / gene=Cvel_18296 / organism=Chromera_velia_CCMP2878 / gene_product=hypothetical protein / transcript_product=hypothetical protein / location=Cvel_scaffold1508:39635-42651(-) / protein_length=885 / sequence_SO=supercontig / SO=protein_coding / is_pseudo=false